MLAQFERQFKQYTVDAELDVNYCDEGPWRNYAVYAEGDTLAELLETACITELDHDGEELDTYALGDCESDEVIRAVLDVIEAEILGVA